MAANTTVVAAIRQRPASCARSSRSTSRDDDAVKRSTSAGPVPVVRDSSTPPIERASSTVTLRSASSRCWAAVIARRMRATRRVSQIDGGSTSRDTSVSCQLSASIATNVATAVVRFEATEVAVEVTTDCMPPMSLVIRDCTSPVRVRVKKATDWRCRCANTSVRSRCMTCCPTVVEIQVWTTPSAAVTPATATMPITSQASRERFRCGRASSMTARSRKGEAIATTDDTMINAVTTATDQW